jgi:hypothetical protein
MPSLWLGWPSQQVVHTEKERTKITAKLLGPAANIGCPEWASVSLVGPRAVSRGHVRERLLYKNKKRYLCSARLASKHHTAWAGTRFEVSRP